MFKRMTSQKRNAFVVMQQTPVAELETAETPEESTAREKGKTHEIRGKGCFSCDSLEL